MQPIDLAALRPGMVVARAVRQHDERVLLARGVALDDGLIRILRGRELGAIWVAGPDDIINGPIEERARKVTRTHLERLFKAGQLAGGSKATSVDRLLDRLAEDVEMILAEVGSGPLSARLGSLQTHHDRTFNHSIDVAIVSAILARKLFLDLGTTRTLTTGALVHDIGKSKVPAAILDKPAKLAPDEWAILRQHAVWGAEILREWPLDSAVPATVALQHHERQDGSGYPHGRRGTNRIFRDASSTFDPTLIHLSAEIVAVADVYVSLINDQAFRPAFDLPDAVNELRRMAGGHLNRQIVEQLLTIVPAFPLGTPVRLLGGRYSNHRGIVVKIEDDDPSRPVVRVLTNGWGERIRAVEIDTRREPDIELRIVLGSAIDVADAG